MYYMSIPPVSHFATCTYLFAKRFQSSVQGETFSQFCVVVIKKRCNGYWHSSLGHLAECCQSHGRIKTSGRHKNQLRNHVPAASWTKSRKSFINTTKPLNSTPSTEISSQLEMWFLRLQDTSAVFKMGLLAAESLSAGLDQPWLCWRSLNSLRIGVGRA